MLIGLADWCYQHRRLVVLMWIGALLGAFALAGAFGGEPRQDYLQPGSESKAASQTLEKNFPERSGDSVQIVLHAAGGVTSPAIEARAAQIFADVAENKHVVSVVSPYSAEGSSQISADGTTAYAEVVLDKTVNEYTAEEAKTLVEPVLAAADSSLRVEMGGQVAALSQTVPVGSEAIGLLAAVVILLIIFGSAVAMGLPLVTALFGLGVTTAVVGLLSRVVDVPDWAPPTAAMVGIGVGIDYALLIVTRYRTSLAEGSDPRQAVRTAVATAGRAVVFAGVVVTLSMLGMLLMDQPSMTGFAYTVSLAILITVAASVTLLPAMLGFAGRNIERWHVPFVSRDARVTETSRWHRWSRLVQRRPWPAAIGALAVVLVLAAPLLSLRLGFPDASNDPPGYTTRQAHELLSEGFGPGFSAPILLVAQGEAGSVAGAAADLRESLDDVAGVAFIHEPIVNAAGDTAVLSVIATTTAQDAETRALVEKLRNDSVPAAAAATGLEVHIGGVVPANIDITRGTADRLPLFFGGVLLVSFLLLLLVFRSLLVPLKAVVMNVLASAAAFGVLALAANGGWFGDLVGIPEETPVPIQLPIGIFAILFGLSMDYEVFLLSRIKEEYDKTGNNARAVADGLAKSARVITAGAAVMVTVFLSFALGDAVIPKMFGIGLASAILIDATLIRMVLVPASMELMGDRNWWLPGWLDRLVPHVRLEGHQGDNPANHLGSSLEDPPIPVGAGGHG